MTFGRWCFLSAIVVLLFSCSNTKGEDPSYTASKNVPISLDAQDVIGKDADGANFEWTVLEAPDGEIVPFSLSEPLRVKTMFTGYLTGTYVVGLVFKEGDTRALHKIRVEVQNDAPTVVAAAPKIVELLSTVSLNAGMVSDNNEDELEISWVVSQTPEGSTLAGATYESGVSGLPTIIPDVIGTYVVTYIVRDSEGLSTTSEYEFAAGFRLDSPTSFSAQGGVVVVCCNTHPGLPESLTLFTADNAMRTVEFPNRVFSLALIDGGASLVIIEGANFHVMNTESGEITRTVIVGGNPRADRKFIIGMDGASQDVFIARTEDIISVNIATGLRTSYSMEKIATTISDERRHIAYDEQRQAFYTINGDSDFGLENPFLVVARKWLKGDGEMIEVARNVAPSLQGRRYELAYLVEQDQLFIGPSRTMLAPPVGVEETFTELRMMPETVQQIVPLDSGQGVAILEDCCKLSIYPDLDSATSPSSVAILGTFGQDVISLGTGDNAAELFALVGGFNRGYLLRFNLE